MTTIDEIGRRAAAEALDDAKRRVDAHAGLAAIRSGGTVRAAPVSPDQRPRRWLLLASLAAAAATIAAITVVARHDPDPRLAPVDSTPAATPATTPASTAASATVLPTTPADTTSPPADCVRETRRTPGSPPASPAPFGPELAAEIVTCSEMSGQGRSIVVDESGVWLAGSTDSSPVLIHLDASLRPIASIEVPGQVIELTIDAGTVWAVTIDADGEHLLRVDVATGTLLSNELLNDVVPADGPLEPVSLAVAGGDVWVSSANDPGVVRHYRDDGTRVGSVPVESAPIDLAAVPGRGYVLTASGEIVAIDTSVGATSVLAQVPAAERGTIAALGLDLWAATSELIHVDLASGTVTDRVTASVGDLAADPHEPGRAWAAPYEPDPTMIPGSGAGIVVRLALHGVQPDGHLWFETTSSNGVSRLAIMPDGTVYGENEYTAQVVRIRLDDQPATFPTLVPPTDPSPLIGATISAKPYEPSPDFPMPPILINGADTNLSSVGESCRPDCSTAVRLLADRDASGSNGSPLPTAMYLAVEHYSGADGRNLSVWRVVDAIAVETNGIAEYVDIALEGCSIANAPDGIDPIAVLLDGLSLPMQPRRVWGWNAASEHIEELSPTVITECVEVGGD